MSTALKKLTCYIRRDTGKAILVVLDEKHEHEVDTYVSPSAFTSGIWIPSSQVKEITQGPEFDEVTITAWIAGQKGIEV